MVLQTIVIRGLIAEQTRQTITGSVLPKEIAIGRGTGHQTGGAEIEGGDKPHAVLLAVAVIGKHSSA